jgi:hypothetical protein
MEVMPVFQRWTVRGVDSEALRMLREVQSVNWPATMGELVSEAIQLWFARLPVADEDSDQFEPSRESDTLV